MATLLGWDTRNHASLGEIVKKSVAYNSGQNDRMAGSPDQSRNLAQVDFSEYVRELTGHLFRSFGTDPDVITLTVNVASVSLSLDVAILCGLIINELVSNCLRHAFPRGREGQILVEMGAKDGKVTLVVSDNGAGFPDSVDFQDTESLGMQLVIILTRQLGGTIELDKSGGTKFAITFAEQGRKA